MTTTNERDPRPGFPPPGGHGEPPAQPPPAQGGGRKRLAAVVIGASLASALLGGAVGGALTDRPAESPRQVQVDPEALSRPAGSTADLAGRALKSTVTVEVVTGRGTSLGSGLVYASGKVLTNAHVVAGGAADEIRVTLPDGTRTTARLAGLSTTYDLAVLELADAGGVPALELGDSDTVRPGDDVIAVGSPHGLTNTVTSGIISATNRPWPAGSDQESGRRYMSALQTDAAINSGNSGGPLINGQGQAIGVNTSIETSGRNPGGGESGNIGLGFAIPINQAKRVADQLSAGEKAKYPIIGVRLRPQEPSHGASGDPSGAVIEEVESGSGAASAGLRAGDVITKAGDTPVTSAEELMAALWRRAPGESVKVTYSRDGSESSADVKLDAQEVS